ncbi:MAG TPA: PqqD family protein [Candidatus Atribacteria bacterium]|nr:PqqD family protein [Candidatus Atribacteria bacterium]HPT77957.1 PqqD family protein [Candidatus Atribacteria bacterium]
MFRSIGRHRDFLKYIPAKAGDRQWAVDQSGAVILFLKRNGLAYRLTRPFTGGPELMKVRLDDAGSFVWQLIDGKKSVGEIGKLLEERFGGSATPLYEKLGIFLTVLKNHRFITINTSGHAGKKPTT